MHDACKCIPADVRCAIAGAATLTASPSIDYRCSKTLVSNTRIPPARATIERRATASLKSRSSGSMRPSVQHVMRLEPDTHPPATPLTAIRTVGIAASLKCTSGPYGTIAHYRELKIALKAESTVTANLNVSMRLDIFESVTPLTLGLSFACTTIQPDYGTYVVGTLKSHIPLELTIKVNTGVQATLTGPGGILTRIGPSKKRKLRWRVDEHPDSTSTNKKYIRRLVVSDRNGCGCEFIHLGIYDLRSGIWEVGTERQVMLVLPQMSALGPYSPPDIYPQYTADGNYRVVEVMNKMYDLYPPTSFVDIEIRGIKRIESPKSITEVPRFVFVYEGCSGSFFLINAECE